MIIIIVLINIITVIAAVIVVILTVGVKFIVAVIISRCLVNVVIVDSHVVIQQGRIPDIRCA